MGYKLDYRWISESDVQTAQMSRVMRQWFMFMLIPVDFVKCAHL